MGFFFFPQVLQNKNVALAAREIICETVFWLDNANMKKGETELLFLPSALSVISAVKSRCLYNTQCPLSVYLLIRLTVIFNIKC